MKKIAPENSLNTYLINISNVDIFAKTNIPTTDLSRLRNGNISAIPAERLYLISLVTKDPIDKVIQSVYPNLKLKNVDKPDKKKAVSSTPFGTLLNLIENNTVEIISYKTGITVSRLKNLARKETAVIESHELILIEMAAGIDSGHFFKSLFQNLKLNSPAMESRLREEERIRSQRNS